MNFRSFRSILASIGAVALMAFASVASAQVQTTSQTPCNGCTTPTPTVPSMGITVGGWVQSGAVGIGETTGFGRTVTGDVATMTDEKFTLGAETFLTGNANPECAVDCRDSQSKLSITGFSKVGAVSYGRATGEGMPTGNAPVAASMSSTGTNSMFGASLNQRWVGTAAPATTAP